MLSFYKISLVVSFALTFVSTGAFAAPFSEKENSLHASLASSNLDTSDLNAFMKRKEEFIAPSYDDYDAPGGYRRDDEGLNAFMKRKEELINPFIAAADDDYDAPGGYRRDDEGLNAFMKRKEFNPFIAAKSKPAPAALSTADYDYDAPGGY